MSPAEWGAIPWYEQAIYREGFRQEGILKDDKRSSESAAPPNAEARPNTRKIDLTSADIGELGGPGGFTVRRAG